MEIKEFIKQNKQNMIDDLKTLVSFDSVSNYDETNKLHPFGDETAKVLDCALDMFQREGLTTKNIDYYAGYGEIGHGDKLIGILAHLDIVPAGEGWETNPFELVEKSGKLIGRGTMDDKGPAVCALYALKYIKENRKDINKRVRLIVGLNEEKGSACIKHYVDVEGHIDYGFTPDASFPGIYGEKGHIAGLFKCSNSKIKKINGGVVPNAVCSKLDIALPLGEFDEKVLLNYLDENNIKYEVSKDEYLNLTTYGTAAHASTPHLGRNAISYTMEGLKIAGFEDVLVNYYHDHIGLATDGSSFDCKVSDEYGDLTFNNGMIYENNGVVYGTIDIRVPLTLKTSDIIDKMISKMNDGNGEVCDLKGGNPLFFDPKSPMVESLVSAYREVTKDYDNEPMVIGGGTYSKGINNCIAFGGEFPGDDNHIHDVNEFIEVEKFLLQTEIYIKAIENLLAL